MADGQITTGIQVNMDFQANYSQLQQQLGQVLAVQAQLSQKIGNVAAQVNNVLTGLGKTGEVGQQAAQQILSSLNNVLSSTADLNRTVAKTNEGFVKAGQAVQQFGRSARSGFDGVTGAANQSANALRSHTQGMRQLNSAFDSGIKKQDNFFNNMGMRLIGSAFSMYFLVRQIQNITNALEKMDVLRASYARIMTANVGEAQIGRASEQMMKESAQIAYKYGATMADVAGTMVEFARQGRSEAEIKYLTASLGELRLMLATSTGRFLSMNDAMKSATTLMTQMDVSVYEAIDALKLMSEYDIRAATSFDQISIAMNRFAAAGKVAGMSVGEIIQVATAFTEIGVGGSRAGTALNTIISRLSGTKDAIKAVQSMNVAMTTMEGGTLRATSAFEQLVDAYRKVVATGSSTQLNQFLSAVGGTRQRSVLAAGLNRYIKQTSSPVSAQEFKPMVDNLYKELDKALRGASISEVTTTSGIRSRSFSTYDIRNSILSNLSVLRKSMEEEFARTGGVTSVNLSSILSSWFQATPAEVQQIMAANKPLFDSISQQFELFALKTESVYSRIARIAQAQTEDLKAQREHVLAEMESTVTVQKNRLITLFEGTFLTAGFIDPFRAGVSALTDGIETLSQTIIGAIGGILQAASSLGSVLPSSLTGIKSGDSTSARGVKTIVSLFEGYLLTRMPFILSGMFQGITQGLGGGLVAPIVGQVQKFRAISQGFVPNNAQSWFASSSDYEGLLAKSINNNLDVARTMSSLVNRNYSDAVQLTGQIAANQGLSAENVQKALTATQSTLTALQAMHKINREYGLDLKPGDDFISRLREYRFGAGTSTDSILSQVGSTTRMSASALQSILQPLNVGAVTKDNFASTIAGFEKVISTAEGKMKGSFVSEARVEQLNGLVVTAKNNISQLLPYVDKLEKSGGKLLGQDLEHGLVTLNSANVALASTQNALRGIGLTLAGLQTGLAWVGAIAGWIGIIVGIGSVIYGVYQSWQKANADAITNVDSLTESLRQQKEAAEGLGRAIDDLNKSTTAIGQAYGIQDKAIMDIFSNRVLRNQLTSRLRSEALSNNLPAFAGLTNDKSDRRAVEQKVIVEFDRAIKQYEDYREQQRQMASTVGLTQALEIIDNMPGVLEFVGQKFGMAGNEASKFASTLAKAASAIGIDLAQYDANIREQMKLQAIASTTARDMEDAMLKNFYGADFVGKLGQIGRPDKWTDEQNAANRQLWERAKSESGFEASSKGLLEQQLNSFSTVAHRFAQEYIEGSRIEDIQELTQNLNQILSNNDAYRMARASNPTLDVSTIRSVGDWNRFVDQLALMNNQLGGSLIPALTNALSTYTTSSTVPRFRYPIFDGWDWLPESSQWNSQYVRNWEDMPKHARNRLIHQAGGDESLARKNAQANAPVSAASTLLSTAIENTQRTSSQVVNVTADVANLQARREATVNTYIPSAVTEKKTALQQRVDTKKGQISSTPAQVDELERRYDYKDLNDLISDAQETGDWSKAKAFTEEYVAIQQAQIDAAWDILDSLDELRNAAFQEALAKEPVMEQFQNESYTETRENIAKELAEANQIVNDINAQLKSGELSPEQSEALQSALIEAEQRRDALAEQLNALNESQDAFTQSVLDYATAYNDWTKANEAVKAVEAKGGQATEAQIKARDEALKAMNTARDNMMKMMEALQANINNAQQASVTIGNGLNKILSTLGEKTLKFDEAFITALKNHQTAVTDAISQAETAATKLDEANKKQTDSVNNLGALSTTPPKDQTPAQKELRQGLGAALTKSDTTADTIVKTEQNAAEKFIGIAKRNQRNAQKQLANAMKGKKGGRKGSQKDPAKDLLQQLQQEHQERLQDIAIMYKTLQDEAGNIIGYMDRTGGTENQRAIIQEQERYIKDLNDVMTKIRAEKDKAKVSRMIASETAKLLELERKFWEYSEKMAQNELKYQLEDIDRPRKLAIDMSDLTKLNTLLSEEYDLRLRIIQSQWEMSKKDEASMQAIRRTFAKEILKDFEAGLKDIITVVDQLNERFGELQHGGITAARDLLFQHRMEYQSMYVDNYPHARFNWVARTSQAHADSQLADLNTRAQHNIDTLNNEVAKYTRIFTAGLNPLVNTGEISTQEAESIFKSIESKITQQVEAGQMAQEAGEYITNLLRNGSGLVQKEFDASSVQSLLDTYKGQFEDFLSSLDVAQDIKDTLVKELNDVLLAPLSSTDITSDAVNKAIEAYRRSTASHQQELPASAYEKLGSLISDTLTPATTPTSLSASYAAAYMSQIKNTLARQVSLGNISQEVMDAVLSVYTDALKTGFKDAAFNEQALTQMLKDKQAEIKASLPDSQSSEFEQQFNSATQAVIAGAPLDITTFLKTYQQIGEILRANLGSRTMDDLKSFEEQYIEIRKNMFNSLDFSNLRDNALIDDVFTGSGEKIRFNYSAMQAVLSRTLEDLAAIQEAYDAQDMEALLEMFGERRALVEQYVQRAIAYGWDDSQIRESLYTMLTNEKLAEYDAAKRGMDDIKKRWDDWVAAIESALNSGWDEGFDIGFEYGFTSEGWDKLKENMRKRLATGIKDAIWKQIEPNIKGLFENLFGTINKEATDAAIAKAQEAAAKEGRELTAKEISNLTVFKTNMFGDFFGGIFAGLFSSLLGFALGALFTDFTAQAEEQLESQLKQQRDSINAQGFNWSYKEADTATPYYEFNPPTTTESIRIVKLSTSINITTEAAAAMISQRRELERVVEEVATAYFRSAYKTVGASV